MNQLLNCGKIPMILLKINCMILYKYNKWNRKIVLNFIDHKLSEEKVKLLSLFLIEIFKIIYVLTYKLTKKYSK
jgi:hypothetical protein